MRASLFLIASALTAVGVVGCASAPPRAAVNAEAPGDEIQRYQAVIHELQARSDIGGARLDLERCEAWLASARGRQASDPGSSDVRLYLDATSAVLVKVKSEMALRDAEAAPSKSGKSEKGEQR